MNYGEIKSLTSYYLKRNDLDAFYPQIFEMVRERISKDARLLSMEKKITPVVTDLAFPIPDDFIELISLTSAAQGGPRPLKYHTKKNLDLLSHQRTGTFGYTIQAGQFLLQSGDSPLSMTYYARPTNLVADSDTNLVLTNFPMLYLYAAMTLGANSTQDTETEMVSRENYQRELDAANDSDTAGRTMGGGLKIQGN